MPLDPRIDRILRLLNSGGPPRTPSVAERRAGLEQLMAMGGPAITLARIDNRMIPGAASPLPARIYTPVDAPRGSTPGLVYFHGGGFVAGSIDTHDGIARRLAQSGKCRIVSVDYRLAPEHPFPAAFDDAIAAVTFVAANAPDFGIDATRLGICGDSAGGTLAAAAGQTTARLGLALKLQLLLCPILDYSRMTESRRQFASGYLVDQAMLEHDLRHYLPPGTDPADPRVSPQCAADLSGTPRTIIHTAEFDPLRDEGKIYFDRLTGTGSALSYTCHPGMIHLFYALGAVVPYVQRAFERIGADIRAALA